MHKFRIPSLLVVVVVVVTISHFLTLQQCCQAYVPEYDHPPPLSSNLCRPDESDALLRFKNSFTIIGDGHDRTASWKGGVNCCLWQGVTCDSFTGHVIGLDLSCEQIADPPAYDRPFTYYGATGRRLQGTLQPNSSIFHLRFLRSLNLAYNDFNGSTIPPSFTKLTSLTHLNLSNTGLTGPIPSGFSHLSKLVLLDLSTNHVSFGGHEDCSKLLANATELSDLWLQGVNMSNIRPSSFSNLSHSLKNLGLHDCGLVGKFPESVFRLPILESVRLTWNQDLLVQFPQSNWSATHLKVLRISFTNCKGQMLPTSIGDFKSLSTLSLCGVGLIGPIPSPIWNLTSLIFLNLARNKFSGSVSTLSNLVQLEELDISSNNFFGSFPTIFGNLTQRLTILSIAQNNFGEYIPSSIFNLPKLQYLECSDNHLVGPLSSEVVRDSLNHFKYILLGGNLLNGTIPSWMLAIPSLRLLDLSYNQLTGEIPEFQSSSLIAIYLDRNRLHGLVPNSVFKLRNLYGMGFGSNKLTGSIPYHICYLTSLMYINLSNNTFSGSIPDCLVNLTQLSILNLRINNFRGPIPSIFGNMSNLEILDLNGNTLGGSLPQSLAKCKMLEVLNVGNNQINDTFPQWLSSLPNLKVLILRSNNFHGSLDPKNNFPELRILDVSNNYFEGPLPASCFHKFPSMMILQEHEKAYRTYYVYRIVTLQYGYSVDLIVKGQEVILDQVLTILTIVDLSNNYFQGKIPDTTGDLRSVLYLNLSHNNFAGPIPSSLGNMTELESLDLSSNQLSGKIPSEFTSLTYLSFLNLSRNALHGPIPKGNQFGTFENASYVGNEGLCGIPLSKKCEGDDDDDHEDSESKSESDIALFDWTFAGVGYGCGLIIGISTFYIIFTIRKPRWLVEMVENWTWQLNGNGRRWRRPITF